MRADSLQKLTRYVNRRRLGRMSSERWMVRVILGYTWLSTVVFLVVLAREGDVNAAFGASFVVFQIAQLLWQYARDVLVGLLALAHVGVVGLGALGTGALIWGAIRKS